MEENKVENAENIVVNKGQNNNSQTQIAGAIIIAGLVIAGAVLLKGGSAPVDLTKASPVFNQCLDSEKYAQAVEHSKSEGNNAGVTGTPKGFILIGDKVVNTIDGAEPFTNVKKKIDDALAGKNTNTINSKLAPISNSDFTLGDAGAKVTIILYEDFQCPFCGRFFHDSEQSIRDTYLKNGQVQLVYRDFAFLGRESTKSAEAARCAGEQGKFWEYHDYLFSHQMGENQGAFSDLNLKSFAGILKLK